jgi:hypothetical protein
MLFLQDQPAGLYGVAKQGDQVAGLLQFPFELAPVE